MGIAAALLTLASTLPAKAQNATWTGNVDNDFNNGGNWTSDPLPPTGTAIFSGAAPVNIDLGSPGAALETIRFIGNTAYRIDVLCGCGLTLTGSGVINDTNVFQTFGLLGGAMTFSNSATVTGQVEINNNGGQLLFGSIFPGGNDTASAGSATIINRNGGVTVFAGNTNAGTADITNRQGGVTFFTEQSSAANSNILIRDTSQVFFGYPTSTDRPTAAFAHIQVNGGDLIFSAFSTADNASIRVRNGGQVIFLENSSGGNAAISTDNNLLTTVDFELNAGPNITAGSIAGGGTFIIGTNNLIVGSNNLSTTVTGIIDVCNCGALTKVGSGTLTLALDSASTLLFEGSLVVNGGTVVVNSDLSLALQAVANPGGTLAGAGILPSTFIYGGTLSPGNGTTGNIAALIITDQVTFTSNGTYRVDVAPAAGPGMVLGAADYTLINTSLISPPSTLAGTVNAVGMGGTGYKVGTLYPIMVGPNGFSGRFDRMFVSGSFGSTRPILAYDDSLVSPTVFIQLIQGEVSSQLLKGATQNQIEVARGIDDALLKGADFGSFTPLYNLTGDAFLNALDQIGGEANTGVFQTVYQSVSNFISSMLNPFNSGRGIFGPAVQYSAEDDDEADAYAQKRRVAKKAQQAMSAAMPVKAEPARDGRYAAWANGYGGQTSIDGNNVVGSHQTNVRGYGFAAGLDFRVAPEALVGFAMAGGGSSWGLSEGLGGGKTDNFHLGAYGSLRYGPAYLSAAMAYGRHWVSTSRTVVVPGFASLEGDYDANSFGGRIEAGYRYGQGSFGITPYAALQASVVRLPGYTENATAGDNAFALQYGRQSDSLYRTELGSWVDHSRVIPGGVMTLRARAAWAHDEGADRALTGGFPYLPGSTFLVQGANPGNNLALLSAGAEWKYWNGMSIAARFDSELSDRSRGFGGSGVFRYVW